MKITIVGVGKVGSAIAFAIVHRGLAEELVLLDRSPETTRGDALDLLHASAFVRPCDVVAGDAAAAAGSDIVIYTASAAPDAAGADRLLAAEANGNLLGKLLPPLVANCPEAIFLLVSNPVDVLTYLAQKRCGLPPARAIGTGTLLDTGRFRALLSQVSGIHSHDIRAYILGEHGESQFPAISVATTGGMRFGRDDQAVHHLAEQAKRGGHDVLAAKGYTNYAIAMATLMVVEAIAGNTNSVMPVSTLVDGLYGVDDVCLSMPCVIGRRGVVKVLPIWLDDDEQARLQNCAQVVRRVIDRVMQ